MMKKKRLVLVTTPRKQARFNENFWATIVSQGSSVSGLVSNVSLGGIYLETTQPFEEGEEVTIELSSVDNHLSLKGEIRWITSLREEGAHYGIGIRLTTTNLDYVNHVVALQNKRFMRQRILYFNPVMKTFSWTIP